MARPRSSPTIFGRSDEFSERKLAERVLLSDTVYAAYWSGESRAGEANSYVTRHKSSADAHVLSLATFIRRFPVQRDRAGRAHLASVNLGEQDADVPRLDRYSVTTGPFPGLAKK